MSRDLIKIVLEFNDEHNIIGKREILNLHFRNFFYPDFMEDGIYNHF